MAMSANELPVGVQPIVRETYQTTAKIQLFKIHDVPPASLSVSGNGMIPPKAGLN
jgi:hypothetical protein